MKIVYRLCKRGGEYFLQHKIINYETTHSPWWSFTEVVKYTESKWINCPVIDLDDLKTEDYGHIEY